MVESEQSGAPAALPRADAARGLALPLLVQLRWLLVAGESGLLMLAASWLAPTLPYTPMWAIVALQGLSNLALARGEPRLLERWLPAVLVLDTVLLTGLLALSGGPHNPFTALYVVHVALAAVAVTARGTAGIAALSAASYGALFYWHVPQPLWQGASGHAGTHVEAHLVGMWLALAVVAAVIAFFIARLTQQLAEARALAERNERLASLTTLAAGTAHELGSPLGTIAVAAREIERGSAGPVRDDARLIRDEVQRCREILDRMSGSASEAEDTSRALRIEDVVAELQAALGADGPRLHTRLPTPPPLLFAPPRAIHQALLALVRNALDVSSEPVELRVSQSDAQIAITVSDRGTGMSQEVLAHAEEPFFTTKEPGQGTGLGLYVVRLIAERLGGSLRLRSAQGQGTDATLSLPRRAAVSG